MASNFRSALIGRREKFWVDSGRARGEERTSVSGCLGLATLPAGPLWVEGEGICSANSSAA